MATEAQQKKASEVIAKKLAEAQKLVTECETIANENGVDFRMNLGGYGMGGYFIGTKSEDDEGFDESAGWKPSSQSC